MPHRLVSRILMPSMIALTLVSGCAEIKPAAEQADANAPLYFPPPPDQPRFVFERTIQSSADIVADSEDDAFRRYVTGESRAGYFLSKPYAVAAHSGRIFVTDTVERQVKVFDIPEKKYFTVGTEGKGQLMKPIGLDVDQAGNVYVADATAKAIQVYDREGKHVNTIGGVEGGKELFDRLASVTVTPSGDKIYVVDIGGVRSENHRVRVFDPRTGEHVMDIGKRGNGPGEFNLPRDVAVGKDGRLYVVDGGNFRIQVFNADGSYRSSFGAIGRQPGNFARPKEIATDREGNVYVVDAAFGNFQIFSPDGELLMYVGQRSEAPGPGRYILPSGISVDSDGRVYFTDQWFRKIDVFRPYDLPADGGFVAKAAPKGATGEQRK